MRSTNKVIEKINKGKHSLGGWVMTNSSTSAEILAQAGFDWVCIDAEHSAVSKETASDIIRAIELHGAEPFVRISFNDEVEIKKYLDIGAKGIIVPMIKSHEEVKRAISYIKYPPSGNRSFALSRCTGYGENADEYFKYSNNNIFIAIMIEHLEAVKDLDQIFSTEEIDAVLIGPYDLSGSMGIPGKFEDPKFKELLNHIYSKAKEHNVTMGFHEVRPTKENIKALIDQGYKFIACGIDTLFLFDKSKEFSSLM
jgi:2-dehydro-3-deoxyglucarate aldolase